MKAFRKVLSILLTVAILSGISPVSASAASFRKCYTISSGNTTVYSNTRLTKKYGTIYGSDEVTVLLVKDAYCKVRYPISRGRTGILNSVIPKTAGTWGYHIFWQQCRPACGNCGLHIGQYRLLYRWK